MKIGILTHYYKSPNYGGNLQAYALAEYLNSAGFSAEQICYDIFFKRESDDSKITRFFKRMSFVPSYIWGMVKKEILLKRKMLFVSRKLEGRSKSIMDFNLNIVRHGSEVYSYTEIARANNVYDAFVTGSDQVWHPNNFCPAYLLTFANAGKKKLSYAASIAKSSLSDEEIRILTTSISDYDAVSVREEDSAELLRKNSPKDISCVVDPVFLLAAEQWNSVAKPCPIEKPYVLTYFLGENTKSRALALQFAKEQGLELISIPYLNGMYRKCDWNYGNRQLFDVGPDHFIALIRNASCIFTDSFHAAAFSIIFDKKFFVFARDSKSSIDMSNRIVSLLDLCRCPDLYCDDEEKLSIRYLNSLFDSVITDKTGLDAKIAYSKNFLLNALK